MSDPTFMGLLSMSCIRSRILLIRSVILFRSAIISEETILEDASCACFATAFWESYSCCSIASALCTSCWKRSNPVFVNTSKLSVFHSTDGATGPSIRAIPGGAFGATSGRISWGMGATDLCGAGITSSLMTELSSGKSICGVRTCNALIP